MSDFVHLHTHSLFSPLDGIASPKEYFKECANRGYVALALTEHGNMASIPDGYWDSQKFNIKFIPGCELYYSDYETKRRELVNRGVKIKELDPADRARLRHRHLTVLCQNMVGYKNLLLMRGKSYDYFFYKPRTNIKILNECHEGLIVMSGCMNGPISFELRQFLEFNDNKFRDKAIILAKAFKEILGDNFYIELQMPGVENDVELFGELFKLAQELKIETVLTNDAHYIIQDDYNLQRIMASIDQNVPFDSPDLFITNSTSGYFKTREDLRNTFQNGHGDSAPKPYNKVASLSDFERACDNTLVIADKCESFNPDLSTKLPTIKDANNKLWMLVVKGLKSKNLHKNNIYKERIKFEMQRIVEKEFSSYFLICRDLVQKSTIDLGMPVGPRGSAGGSLVCYLIGIHEIDPIEWNLSFDRFLSSSRGGKMLRIDMDGDEKID